jgi:hypothetical protein
MERLRRAVGGEGFLEYIGEAELPPGSMEHLKALGGALGLFSSTGDIWAERLPFVADDVTGGSENELQTVVIGASEDVDLASAIADSSYYRHLHRRVDAGEYPRRMLAELDRFLSHNGSGVWENSWVRFPRRRLSPHAAAQFTADLRSDKGNPLSPERGDAGRFSFTSGGEEYLRVPVSYLLRLALADAGSRGAAGSLSILRSTAERIGTCFVNDNTSPETHSLHPVMMGPTFGAGRALAEETALRFLLTQLLASYANERFGLVEAGQRVVVYCAPHPPLRQKALNGMIPDSFYRELFMSPCLSGWRNGEAKYRYMNHCHETLSRSQLNAIRKLKDAGIITNNLVTVPNTSNISLANNGTHVSLGSRRLTALIQASRTEFTDAHEKFLGDLVIKIVEHFLPLFVGTLSAAPYRLDFSDFHPENVLGFLPHELDYTHLRMVWRRWRKKADLKLCGQPFTPFGPKWFDDAVSRLLRLKGDYVPDFRLIDYPVALLSTDESPALDGMEGNDDRLKRDLAMMGVFSREMALYIPYRQRRFASMGFSGFEGRHYSIFPSFLEDLSHAATLQALVTALAYKYVFSGRLSHADIPHDPTSESERRQIFFGTAIGIPTFYVRRKSPNRFLMGLLSGTARTRFSRRYRGYIRVHNAEYRWELLRTLRRDGADLVEALGAGRVLAELEDRLREDSSAACASRLTDAVCLRAGVRDPFRLSASGFNAAAEDYYRTVLRKSHTEEGITVLGAALRKLDGQRSCRKGCPTGDALRAVLGSESAVRYLEIRSRDLLEERLTAEDNLRLIHLILLVVSVGILEYDMSR